MHPQLWQHALSAIAATCLAPQISIKEGLIAPVAASVSLFTCYLIVTFLPDLDISKLLNGYFWYAPCSLCYLWVLGLDLCVIRTAVGKLQKSLVVHAISHASMFCFVLLGSIASTMPVITHDFEVRVVPCPQVLHTDLANP